MDESMEFPSFSTPSSSSSASVYTNPFLTKPRSSRGKVVFTGEDFINLQKEMAAPRPTGNLSALPDLALFDLLTCIRCGGLCHPQNYLVCEDGGHHICRPCAQGLTRESSESALAANDRKKFYPAKVLEACCAYRKLRKGSPMMLKALWDRAMWRCPNQRNGCSEMLLGRKWDEHLEGCKFKSMDPTKLRCYFHGCAAVVGTIPQLVEHYKKGHEASVVEVVEGVEVGLKIVFMDMLENRHVSLIRLKEPKSLLVVAYEACKETETLHIWVWNISPNSKLDEAVDGVGLGARGGVMRDRPQSNELNYNLKILQIREYEGLQRSELTSEEACLPHNLTPEEIMAKKGTVKHFKIGLVKLLQGCVERTPDDRGLWRLFLRFQSKKGKGQEWGGN